MFPEIKSLIDSAYISLEANLKVTLESMKKNFLIEEKKLGNLNLDKLENSFLFLQKYENQTQLPFRSDSEDPNR